MDTELLTLIKIGGPAMWLIGLCSVAAVAVAVERVLALWRFGDKARSLADAVTRALFRGDVEDGRAQCERSDSPAAEVFLAALVASSAAQPSRAGLSPSECPDPAWFVVDGADASPLTTALGNLAAAYGADFDAGATSASLASVPLELQRALVPVVNALSASWQTIQDARAPASALLVPFGQAPDWVRGVLAYKWTAAQLTAFDSVDVGAMAQAALWIATAVESADLKRFAGATFDAVTLDTPLGKFVMRGAGNDDYDPGNDL